MELHVFMTCEEFVALLNDVAEEIDCRILVAESRDAAYRALERMDLDTAMAARNIELGSITESVRLLNKPVKDIYRLDREGFISVHSGCESKDANVLIETTFTADSSASAKVIFSALKKAVGKMSNKGVKAINEESGHANISNSFYWTDNAVKTGKIWRQTESSWVRFEPAN